MENEQPDKFPCTSCGECCRRVGYSFKFLPKDVFPYKAKEDGSCEMLMENGMCQVYEARPSLCNIETMFAKVHYKTMTRNEAFHKNAMFCNKWMLDTGWKKENTIDLKQFL